VTKNIKSELTAIIPSGDKLTRTFPVKFVADIKDIFVFDGQQAKVSLSKNAKKDGLLLPRDSVIKRFGQNVVFVINDKMLAQMIPVQVVGYVNESVAISGQGLVVGMEIVVKGNERVFPNSPVKIINK
jgi:multidrug efflux pump subunit AcrA (membrane-fusion protein)